MRNVLVLIILLMIPALAAPVYTTELTSPKFKIDKIYRSMRGPSDLQVFQIREKGERELLWVVGYEAFVVDPKKGKMISQEFLCHSNLDYTPKEYKDTITGYPLDGRFFTLSQGQQKVDFPEGFGIPVYSDEKLSLGTQVLNLNDPKLDRNVKFKVRIRYKRDSELESPMVALRQIGVQGLKSLTGDEAQFGVKEEEGEHHGPSCSVGLPAVTDADHYEDHHGQRFTGHWVVKPGREVNHTNITRYLSLTDDIDIHYVAIHLHPFAESLELRDLTTGKTVFKGQVTASKGKIGIDHIDHYASKTGFKLRKDHEYSLISVYNNTSGEDVDSMAVMYFYAAVKGFKSASSR